MTKVALATALCAVAVSAIQYECPKCHIVKPLESFLEQTSPGVWEAMAAECQECRTK